MLFGFGVTRLGSTWDLIRHGFEPELSTQRWTRVWWSSAADAKILRRSALIPSWHSERGSGLVANRGKASERILVLFWCYFTVSYMSKVFVNCFGTFWEGTWCSTARKGCYYIATKHSVLQTAHLWTSFFFTKAFCSTPAVLSAYSVQKTSWALKKAKCRQDFQGCLNGLGAQTPLKGHSPRRCVLCCSCSDFRVL